tara:strand:- start:364 stop:729 length:366 start_codon:yes stop_codon:yes gene_type:complete
MEELSSLRPPDEWQNGEVWSLRRLGFNRPDDHPEVIPRGKRGRALIEPGQIWVEGHTQHLCVVAQAVVNETRKTQFYNLDIVAKAYRGFDIIFKWSERVVQKPHKLYGQQFCFCCRCVFWL